MEEKWIVNFSQQLLFNSYPTPDTVMVDADRITAHKNRTPIFRVGEGCEGMERVLGYGWKGRKGEVGRGEDI